MIIYVNDYDVGIEALPTPTITLLLLLLLHKFGFSKLVVNKWNNSLLNWVVSANTTSTFKARLDKFWHNQDIVCDFRAQLQGTGSCSEVLCEKF